MANGDLTTGTIEGDGELFAAFRNMIENLRQLAGRIGKSSNSVATAAAGMFASVREQEASATQQNAALEEIRRTVEALASSAEHVAEDAAMVREMAQRSLSSTQHTAEQTRLVSSHSSRIGEILSLIQDIADKSDLLALNAALEGTKAGEVGRGFSLVAAEMRRLSEHVMDSVRDIRKLVADMHQASHASVAATEEGTKLARETAAAAAKISDAVARQREGTSQVKTAIVEIVGAVNDSLTGSNDSTRNGESLLQLSHELKLAAKKFRVSGHDSAELGDELRDELIASFSRSMPTRVAEATELWLAVEQGNPKSLATLRRLLHTVKGEAHMLELETCGQLAELAESVVDALRRAGAPTTLTGDALLSAFEGIGMVSGELELEDETVLEPLYAQLRAAIAELDAVAAASPAVKPKPDAPATEEKRRSAPPEKPEKATEAVLRAEEVRPLVHEMRRLYGEQTVFHERLREMQRMLRALLVEIDPRHSPETLVERDRQDARLRRRGGSRALGDPR